MYRLITRVIEALLRRYEYRCPLRFWVWAQKVWKPPLPQDYGVMLCPPKKGLFHVPSSPEMDLLNWLCLDDDHVCKFRGEASHFSGNKLVRTGQPTLFYHRFYLCNMFLWNAIAMSLNTAPQLTASTNILDPRHLRGIWMWALDIVCAWPGEVWKGEWNTRGDPV